MFSLDNTKYASHAAPKQKTPPQRCRNPLDTRRCCIATTSKHWAHKAYDATVGAALRTINSPWSVEAIDSVNAKYMRSQRRDKLKKGKGESWERCEAHVGNRDDCEKDRCYYDSHADRCVPPQFGAQLKKEYLKQTLREGGEEFSAAESKRQRRRRQFLEDAKGDRYWKVTKRRRRPRQAIEANARNGLVTKKKKGTVTLKVTKRRSFTSQAAEAMGTDEATIQQILDDDDGDSGASQDAEGPSDKRLKTAEANPCEDNDFGTTRPEPKCAGHQDLVSTVDINADTGICHGKTCWDFDAFVESVRTDAGNNYNSTTNTHVTRNPLDRQPVDLEEVARARPSDQVSFTAAEVTAPLATDQQLDPNFQYNVDETNTQRNELRPEDVGYDGYDDRTPESEQSLTPAEYAAQVQQGRLEEFRRIRQELSRLITDLPPDDQQRILAAVDQNAPQDIVEPDDTDSN